MADLTGLGGLTSILQIGTEIAKKTARLSNLKKAPQEIREFKLSCTNFGGIVQMFYQVSKKSTEGKDRIPKEWEEQIASLVLQGRQVEKELGDLLGRLEKKSGEGILIDLMEWWENVLWTVFQKEPVKHLKLNMSTACAYIQSFIVMVTLDALQLQWERCGCAEEKRELRKQIASLTLQLEVQSEAAEHCASELREMNKTMPLSREERRENRLITKGAKRLRRSLGRRLESNELRSETTSYVSNSNESSELFHRFREGEYRQVPETESSPWEQPPTVDYPWRQSPSDAVSSAVQQSVVSISPHLSVPSNPGQPSSLTRPLSIQAPRIRDTGSGPEESYGRWPDSIVHSREMEEEPEDSAVQPSANDDTIPVGSERWTRKVPDSVTEQMIGNGSQAPRRAHIDPLRPRKSGSKKAGKRREIIATNKADGPSSWNQSETLELKTNVKQPETGRANGNGAGKQPRLPSTRSDRLNSAERYHRRQRSHPGDQGASGSRRNAHEEQSTLESHRDHDSSNRHRDADNRIVQQNASRVSGPREERPTESGREPYNETFGAESSRTSGSSPRNQSTPSSAKAAKGGRGMVETSKQATDEAREKFQGISGDHKKPKQLKRLNDKRRRDTTGTVLGDPQEDDVARRKRRNRGWKE